MITATMIKTQLHTLVACHLAGHLLDHWPLLLIYFNWYEGRYKQITPTVLCGMQLSIHV